MPGNISARFCIGTEEDIRILSAISKATAKEKYTGKVGAPELEAYIESTFNDKKLISELNSLSNQFLIVYVDGEAAGYACVTAKGERPQTFKGRSAVRIADFGVLQIFDDLQIKKRLFEKCLSLCMQRELVWINDLQDSPLGAFFSSYGFVQNTTIAGKDALGLPVLYWVRASSIH